MLRRIATVFVLATFAILAYAVPAVAVVYHP